MTTLLDELKAEALKDAALILGTHRLWNDVVMFVGDLWESDLTPEAKHEKVKQDLFIVFGELEHSLVDIFIKLAYLYLKLTLPVAVAVAL